MATYDEDIIPQILNGRILYLCLKNFMCHDYFEIKFNERMNFISGPNGSGKSAIMSAIMLILGGKATHTLRASSVKEFIKEGKKSAEIIIHLKNNEDGSYREDLYGSSVVIQKIFNLNGSIYQKIYGANHKTVVSTKAKDVHNICNALNIQASNPILLLTQDMSRTFFHNSTPKKLYEAVNQALKMDEISNTYNETKEKLNKVDEIFNNETKSVRECEAQILELEKQLKKYELLRSLKMKIDAMKEELQWVEYNQSQNEIANTKQKISDDEMNLTKLNEKIDCLKAEYNENDKTNKKMEVDIIEMSKQCKVMKSQHESKVQTYKQLKQTEKAIKMKLNTIVNHIKNVSQEKETLKNTLLEITQNDMGGRKRAERLEKGQKLKDLKDKLETLTSMRKTHTMDSNNFENAIGHEMQQHQKIASDLNYVGENLRRRQEEMRDVSNSQRDSALIYGEFIPNLLHAIDGAHHNKKFSRKPKGPIGLFIKLKNKGAALALENCLKKVLRNFICHSKEDYNVLQEIMNAHCPRHFSPTISIFKYQEQTYDVKRYLCTYDNAFNFTNLIEIADVDVFNYIMDQKKLESVLFWPETEEVATVFSGNQRPRNCSEAYAFNGDLYQYRDNSLSTYPCTFNRPKFLSLDQSGALTQLKEEMGELENKRAKLQGDKAKAMKEVESLKARKQKSDDRLKGLNGEIASLQKKINELQDHLSHEDPVDALECDMESLNQEVRECDDKIAKATTEKKLLEKELNQDIKTQLEEVTCAIKELEGRASNIRENIKTIEEDLGNANDQAGVFKSEILKSEHAIERQKNVIRTHKSKLEEQIKSCEERFPREKYNRAPVVKKFRSREEITSSIEKAQREVLYYENETNASTHEECKRVYETKKCRIEDSKKKCHEFKRCHKMISRELERHQAGFQTFQTFLHSRISGFFSANMKHRNFHSKLRVDVANKEIIIHVRPDKNVEYSTDLKALSGGERSYTSICFLLALWSCINTPFICLDEFDVFMDLLNRDIGKELLIMNSKSTNCSQMIILTPLEIGNVVPSKDISIWKLKAPERT